MAQSNKHSLKDEVFPFSISGIYLAEIINPEKPGSIFIVGPDLEANTAASAIESTCGKLGKKISVSNQLTPNLTANLIALKNFNDAPRALLSNADAVVFFGAAGSEVVQGQTPAEIFMEAVAAVDVTCDVDCFRVMNLDSLQGIIWIKGEGITKVSMEW